MSRQFLRYALSGLLAFAVEFLSFYLLITKLSMSVMLASGISFCLGLAITFTLNRAWAFASHEYSKKAAHQLTYYTILASLNLFLTVALVGVFQKLGLLPMVGKFIAMVLTSGWNFLLLKFFVFSHKT